MPVVGRSNHHCIDFPIFEQLAEIGVLSRIAGVLDSRLIPVRPVDVTESHHLITWDILQQRKQVLATAAGANRANSDAVIGAAHGATRKRCRYGCIGQKLSAIAKHGPLDL